MILAEPAGTARAGREVHVIVSNVLLALRGNLALQKVHQASGGEDGGAARTHVDQFLARVQIIASDVRQGLRFVIQIVEGALNQPFVFPGQAAVENRNVVALLSLKWAGLVCFVVIDWNRRTDGGQLRSCHDASSLSNKRSSIVAKSCVKISVPDALGIEGHWR